MKTNKKRIIRIVMFLILTIVLICVLNHIFLFRDQSIWSTDSRVTSYQKLPDNSLDILFLGSSNLMSGVNPIQLWEETNMQSYNYCSRAQTIPFSYEYLKDALETQTPECVVLDVYGAILQKEYNELANNEFHFYVNIDNLSFDSKFELLESVNFKERLYCIFPLLRNHNNYKVWENMEEETDEIFMGYCFVDTVEPCEVPVYTSVVSPMEKMDDVYLRKIIGLCQKKEIDLYVVKTPVALADESHRILNGVGQVCKEYGLEYYDMALDAVEWGFDYSLDMMDSSHVNANGAVKVTEQIGKILNKKYDFSNSSTHINSYVWENEKNRMNACKKNVAED